MSDDDEWKEFITKGSGSHVNLFALNYVGTGPEVHDSDDLHVQGPTTGSVIAGSDLGEVLNTT